LVKLSHDASMSFRCCIICLLMPATLVVAQTTRPSADLRRLVRQLDDASPEIRESAAQALMGLSRPELLALRDAAMAQRPLSAGQLAVLREAVMQVFLETEPYLPDQNRGFLGLHWPHGAAESYDTGIIVADRIPGFGAYRLLRPGDVIVKMLDFPNVDLHTRLPFTQTIIGMPAGALLRLQVLRDGRVIDVSITLAPRPLELPPEMLNPDKYDSWLNDRMQKAQQYWDDTFGALAQDLAQTVQSEP
jgi:hypothetical protein